jgi:integrase/recombinase XerC/integrase/recombinase XerD
MDLSQQPDKKQKRSKAYPAEDPPSPFESFPNYEEGFTNNSPVFPSPPFLEETITTLQRQDNVKRRSKLDHLLGKIAAQQLPGKEHFEAYLRHQHRHNCRPNTLRNSYTALTLFLAFLRNSGKSCVEEITRWDIEAYIEHEQDRNLKPATVRTRLAIVKAFVRYLAEGAIVAPDVIPWKMRIKLPETLPRALDPDDVKQVLAVNGSIRDRAMVIVLLRTGMRIGELLNTRVSDVNLKERKVLIFESAKNRLGRVVYFSDDARDALKAWLRKRDPQEEFLFYGWGGKPLSYTAARMIFVRYLNKAGIADKGYTLHSLRHTYATELLNAGMRLECLEKLLGHTSLEVTRRYARLTDKTREREYFRAMSIIERGELDGHYQLDCELPEVLKTKELFPSYGEDLPEHP